MFEATLHAADPDRQRLQRLTFSAAIAVASTSTLAASLWTLERLGIDRVTGPVQQLEILQFSLLPAPKPVQPPPPPPVRSESAAAGSQDAAPDFLEETSEPDDDLTEPTPSDALTQPQRGNPLRKGGTGPLGGVGCPANICGNSLNPDPTGDCVGPTCGPGTKPSPVAAAPTEVEFSALRCLACADPDKAALRKTVASLQKRSGTVTVKFCVDQTGRVEPSSIKVSRSFGVAAVDQVTTAAIKGWRFSPLKVGGKPRRACSRTQFNIRFD